MPYTASESHSAWGARNLYQDVKVSASRKRNAPLKSTTRRPALSKDGANSAETSWGVARNAVPALLEVMASTKRGRSGASPQPRNCGKSSAAFRAVRFADV